MGFRGAAGKHADQGKAKTEVGGLTQPLNETCTHRQGMPSGLNKDDMLAHRYASLHKAYM